MSTECKDCKFREGDCGNHFISNGSTNYDIASLSACDKYGNCMFFERMAESKGDLISREALKKALESPCWAKWEWKFICECIDNAPTVEPEITNDDLQAAMTESYHLGYELAETKFKRSQGEWIFKEITDDYRVYGQCSICKHRKRIDNFCPNCGAKMDKEAEDGK